MKIRLLLEAERDLEIGADFYESQRPGLGSYFNDCLTADIESLRILLASMKYTMASGARFQSVFSSRDTTSCQAIALIFTLYLTQGKTRKP
jgi:hypothetical protein